MSNDKFLQPTDAIIIESRSTGPKTLLDAETLAAGRARIAAGEDPDTVAADLAQLEIDLIKAWSGEDESEVRAAAHRVSPLHAAADAHVGKLSVALRYAFAMGRRAMGKDKPNVDACIAAIREALEDVLPPTLRKVLAAGGEAGLEILQGKLRTAAFNQDQARDEQGQWTAGGSNPVGREIVDGILSSGVGSDHVHSLYSNDPSGIAEALNLNSVRDADIEYAKARIKELSQEKLRQNFGEEVTAYRGTTKTEGKTPTLSLSLRESTARFHAQGREVKSYQIKTKDVLSYSEAIGKGTFAEEEIIVPWSLHLRTAAFNQDQPRDEQGQWSTSGAGHTARHKELGVPPAWKDVRINKDKDADLLATGIDAKGRKQYIYSAQHSERAAASKFARLKDFNEQLPGIRKRVAADLRNPELSDADREAASALMLIDRTGFRVGSDTETGAEKQAYGASTLLAEHVTIQGDTVTFRFVGKKGVDIEKSVKDRELVAMIKPRVSAGGKLFKTSDAKVRDYLHSRDGDFKVKDFRTWHGTTEALHRIKSIAVPTSEAEFKRARNTIGDYVAAALGNTRAVALTSYIDPAVFSKWKNIQ